ncbi:unnamed protein product, partial [marine sediment metagenome]
MKSLIEHSFTACIESQSFVRSYFFELFINDIFLKTIQDKHKNDMYNLLEDPIKMHEVFKYLRDQEYLRFLDIDEL